MNENKIANIFYISMSGITRETKYFFKYVKLKLPTCARPRELQNATLTVIELVDAQNQCDDANC